MITKTHELAQVLLALPDQEVFVDGRHDHGIVRLEVQETTVKKTGENFVGEVLRVWEESHDGIKAVVLRKTSEEG
ncbi:MAG: hypothetical protein WCZ10_14330 [Desulfobulbaceae bacterium]